MCGVVIMYLATLLLSSSVATLLVRSPSLLSIACSACPEDRSDERSQSLSAVAAAQAGFHRSVILCSIAESFIAVRLRREDSVVRSASQLSNFVADATRHALAQPACRQAGTNKGKIFYVPNF